MKTFIFLLASITILSSCNTPDSEGKKQKDKIDKIVEDAERRSEEIVNNLYKKKVGMECDLTTISGNQEPQKVFYITATDKRDDSLNIRLFTVDSSNPEKATRSINVNGTDIGFLYLKLNDLGDYIFTTSELISGKEGTITYADLRLDKKTGDVEGAKRVMTLPTEEITEMTENSEEWFSIRNCLPTLKEVMAL